MSSSGATSSFGFSTFTTSFSTDTNDGIPSYNDLFASAPLLDGNITPSIFGRTTNVSFDYDRSNSFGYSFLVRDSRGCLQAKGDVDNLNTTILTINGTEMLQITEIKEGNETNVHIFQISHNRKNIGTVKVAEKEPASTCLQINHNDAYNKIVVKSLKMGEFAIYRPNSMTSPLSNIHMPCSSEEFNGSIIFHPESGITAEEQLLCVGAAIAFKVTMKQRMKYDDINSNILGYGLGILITVLLILGFVLLFIYLEKRSCERRKAAHYIGYVGKQC